MALIKLSAIGITAMSGTTGGQTFAFNRAGKYVRNWAKPTNPQTDVQTANRALFGFLSQAWGSLSPEEVNAWNMAAQTQSRTNRLGESYSMNGFTYFKSVNQNLITSGLETGLTTTPPAILDAPDPIVESFVVLLDAGVLDTAEFEIEFPVAVAASTMTMSVQLYLEKAGKNQGYGTVKSLWGAKTYYPVPATAEGAIFTLSLLGFPQLTSLGVAAGDKIFARLQTVSISGTSSVAVTTDTLVGTV